MSDERPNRLRAAAEEAMAAGLARSVSIVEQSGMVVVSKAEWEAVQGEVAVLRARSVADAPDPAPSPSIPDPSDERTHWNLDAFGEALVHTDGSLIEPGDVSIEALVDLIAAVDIHNQITAAARPTSLPEARELGEEIASCSTCNQEIAHYPGDPWVHTATGEAFCLTGQGNARPLLTFPLAASLPEAPERDWAVGERWLFWRSEAVATWGGEAQPEYVAKARDALRDLIANTAASPSAASGGDGEGTGNDG